MPSTIDTHNEHATDAKPVVKKPVYIAIGGRASGKMLSAELAALALRNGQPVFDDPLCDSLDPCCDEWPKEKKKTYTAPHTKQRRGKRKGRK